jgi:hypothetical protein
MHRVHACVGGCEAFHGLLEITALLLLHKRNDIPVRPAGEAMEGLLPGIHLERWMVVIVERAKPQGLVSLHCQFRIPPDYGNDIQTVFKSLYIHFF